MRILITKDQLKSVGKYINEITVPVFGKEIVPPTKVQQGIIPMGEDVEVIDESPDKIFFKNGEELNHRADDALAFGFFEGKCFLSFNEKLRPELTAYVEKNSQWKISNLKTHNGIDIFYDVLKQKGLIATNRHTFEYSGRLWFDEKIISFWRYPSKNELPTLLEKLSKEINRIYKVNINFDDYRIEIKGDDYVADIDPDDDEYMPDIEWERSLKNGNLIPIRNYIGSSDASSEEMKQIHLLPSDEKKNTPQMKAAMDDKYKHIGDKLGSMTQAEYNHYKRYGMGESTIKESPDSIYSIVPSPHWSDDDALSFGFVGDRAFIGLNLLLFYKSPNISDEKVTELNGLTNSGRELRTMHGGINNFYELLYGKNDAIPTYRSKFEFPGRIWFDRKIISFWKYPDKNKLYLILKSINREVQKIYGTTIDFSNFKIENNPTGVEYDFKTKDHELIPVSEYTGGRDYSDSDMENIHLLPSDEKKNTPQMKAAREADAERLANKFNGNVSQAEWNFNKNKYRGESKTIKITSAQLNEIRSYLEDNNNNNNNSSYLKWKRNNVTVRGIKELGIDNNVYGSFGKGLYTTPLSNKSMAKGYGELYFVVNGKPKNPKIVDSLNNAEILRQKLVMDFCKKHGENYNTRFFEENTSMEKEMLNLGYGGLIIKGREMVNYKPENVKYYRTESELINYYERLVDNDNLIENITIPVTTGDTIMTGKFKNKKTVVKTIDKDKHGMPTINGKQATTFRTVNEATESDVNLSSFTPKKELNKKFWVNEKLKPVVRKRLLKIADDYLDFLNVDINKCKDVLFLGSLANYNWSKYSDVDLHLLIDFSKINKDVEFVKDYFDSKNKLWNTEHDELKIFGFPIQVYVQDVKEQNASVGVFSLETNKWLSKPEEIDESLLKKDKIKEKSAQFMTIIDSYCGRYDKNNNEQLEKLSKDVKKLYDKIRKLRKTGLESVDGEMSVGNIVFKVLRRTNYIEKLIDLKTKTYDKINSLKM